MIALSLRPVRLTGKQALAKRAFDLVMGSLVLLVTLLTLILGDAAAEGDGSTASVTVGSRVGPSKRPSLFSSACHGSTRSAESNTVPAAEGESSSAPILPRMKSVT